MQLKPLRAGSYEIRGGFDGDPCFITVTSQRKNKLLNSLGLAVLSAAGVAEVSISPGNKKKEKPGVVMLLVTPGHGKLSRSCCCRCNSWPLLSDSDWSRSHVSVGGGLRASATSIIRGVLAKKRKNKEPFLSVRTARRGLQKCGWW